MPRPAALANAVLAVPLVLALAVAPAACKRSSTSATPPGPAFDAGAAGEDEAEPRVVPQEVGPVDLAGDPLPPGAVARLGTVRFLDPALDGLAFAAGGKELVSRAGDGYAIWDATTGRRIAALAQDDPGPVLAVSPGGGLLATQVAGQGKAQLWDLAGRKPLGELPAGREIDGLCFPDDGTVVSASDGRIVAWKIGAGELERVEPPSTDLTALGCAAGVAAWGDDAGSVVTLGLGAKAAPVALGSIGKRVTAIAVSPDGAEVAAGASDGNVYLWRRAKPGEPIVIQAHDRTVATVAWSGDVLWTSGGDAWLRSWSTSEDKAGALLKELEAIGGLSAQFLAIAPGGKRGATWATHRGPRGSEAGRFWLWDLETGDPAAEPERHAAGLTAIAWSADGAALATAGEDHAVRVWEPGGKPVAVLTAHEAVVNALAFAPDGATIYSAGADAFLRAWLWKADRDDKLLGPIGGEVNALAVAADGARLVTGDEIGRVWSWDLPARARLQAHDRRAYASITGVALAPDGKRLAIAGSERDVLLVDLGSGAELARLKPDVVSNFAVAWSPDGKLLATAGDDGRVRLWDATTFAELRALEGHDGTVRCLAFSKDGVRLASGGNDGTARLWKVADGAALAVFQGHGGAVTGVAIAPDGTRVATASQDRTGLVWKVP